MKLYITGIAGTGKTTLAEAIRKCCREAISIDEVPGLCYWVNNIDSKKVDYEAKLDAEFIDSHVWMCDTEKLKDLIKDKVEVFVFGISENQRDYLDLFDKVILLECKPETFIQRILERKDNDFGKDKGAQEYLLNTYKDFESDMTKLGAVVVNVDRSIDDIVEEIINQSQ